MNSTIATIIRYSTGCIAYANFAYAVEYKLAYVRLKNKAGQFVSPSIKTFQSAAAHVDWQHATDFDVVVTDQQGKNSWPIMQATFILTHKKQRDVKRAQALLKWCAWSLDHGQKQALKLEYAPLPESVVKLIKQRWTKNIRSPKGQILWPEQPDRDPATQAN